MLRFQIRDILWLTLVVAPIINSTWLATSQYKERMGRQDAERDAEIWHEQATIKSNEFEAQQAYNGRELSKARTALSDQHAKSLLDIHARHAAELAELNRQLDEFKEKERQMAELAKEGRKRIEEFRIDEQLPPYFVPK